MKRREGKPALTKILDVDVDVDVDIDVDALLVYDDEDACEVMGCGRWVKPRQPSCIKDSLPLWQRD